jgi:hypothetical protein
MIKSTIKAKVNNIFLATILFFTGGMILQAQAPEVGDITRDNPVSQMTNSTSLTWEVQFDKIIDNNSFTTDDLTLTTVSGDANGSISSISGTGNTYTVNVNSVSGDGTLRLDFTGEVEDFSNNTSQNNFTSGETYILDNTAPSVLSITVDSPATSPTNSSTATWQVTFSEDVSGSIATSDFTKNGSPSGTISSVTMVSPTVYNVTMTSITGDGELTIDFTGTAVDQTGNNSTETFEEDETIEFDNTAAEVEEITRNNPSSQSTNNSTLIWEVVFSEDIQPGTLTTSDFVLNGEPSGTISSVNGNGDTYTVTVTSVSGDGSLQLDYSGDVTDLVGNSGISKFTEGENYILDNTNPEVVSITRSNPTSTSVNQSSVTYNVRFSESVTSASVSTADFSVRSTGTANGSISSVSGSGSSYNVTVTNVRGDGNLFVDFVGTVTDLVGNNGSTNYNRGENYIITSPFVTSIRRSNPSNAITNANSVTFQVTYSKSVNSSTVNTSDFEVVTTGTVSGNISSVSGSGTNFFVTVNSIEGDGQLSINFMGEVDDNGGNPSVSTFEEGENYDIDNTYPTIELVTIFGDNGNGEVYTGDYVYVNYRTSETTSITVASIEGDTDVDTYTDGTSGQVSYMLTNQNAEGPIEFTITVDDEAGNRVTFTETTDDSEVTFVKTPPNIIIIDQPKDIVECVGSTDKFFSVIAAPSDRYFEIAYRWWKDGSPVSDAKIQNGLLALDTLDYNMSGLYTVEIWAIDTMKAGDDAVSQRISESVYSTPANLYVLQRPEFLSPVPNVTATVGTSHTFTFDAHFYGEHNMEDPSYWTQIDWYKGNVELEDNDRYEGTNASILTIENLQADDYADDYRVRLIGECDTVWSNNFSISAEPEVNITAQPISVDGCVDDVVQITTEATVTVQGTNIMYQWMVNGAPIMDEAGKFSGTNTPNLNVTLTTDLGYDGTEEYTCMIYPEGYIDNSVVTDAAMITWKTAPFISADLNSDYSVEEEQAITLAIAADGENLTYTWMKDGNDLGNDQATYDITSATMDDAGEYMVTITNDCGEVMSTTATLVVTAKTVATSVTADHGLGLEQNYPNPVIDNTTIRFNSEVSGQAVLALTDMMGNTVTNLFNGFVTANSPITTNINTNQLNLTSGTYFVTLRMGSKVETIQISVIK